MTQTQHHGKRLKYTGVVSRGPKDKTIVVKSTRLVKHPVYHRYVRSVSVYKVHDERQEAQTGDTVEIMEARPISKTKHWRLVRVITRGAQKSEVAS